MTQQKNTTAFNRTLFFNNLRCLAKENNKNLGELEKELGVSRGYISRSSKGSSVPSVELVSMAAGMFHISVDSLLSVDLTERSKSHLHITQFLEKMIKDTSEERIKWSKVSQPQLSMLQQNKAWRQGSACVGGFTMRIGKNTDVYILSVRLTRNGMVSKTDHKELWLCPADSGTMQFLCSTSDRSVGYTHLIDTLYDAAHKQEKRPHLKRESLQTIFDYLQT